MQKTFKLLIMTPEKEFYNGDAGHIIVGTPDGDMGIMADHMPVIAVVTKSTLRAEIGGEWRGAAIGEGFLDISSNTVELFTDSAEWIEPEGQRQTGSAGRGDGGRMRGDTAHTGYLHTHTAVARAAGRANAPVGAPRAR